MKLVKYNFEFLYNYEYHKAFIYTLLSCTNIISYAYVHEYISYSYVAFFLAAIIFIAYTILNEELALVESVIYGYISTLKL